ncbi:MAG: hypothetical protein U1C51_10020 [Candidatus Izemoplasmatales bacterium]|nr:hypothetical protein [bacterium]MDZ4197565.1 hypothetical protein [Candidatus Izemoplasmatales bacterium]
MKKRVLFTLLLCLLYIFLSACDSSTSSSNYLEPTNTTISGTSENTTNPDSLSTTTSTPAVRFSSVSDLLAFLESNGFGGSYENYHINMFGGLQSHIERTTGVTTLLTSAYQKGLGTDAVWRIYEFSNEQMAIDVYNAYLETASITRYYRFGAVVFIVFSSALITLMDS